MLSSDTDVVDEIDHCGSGIFINNHIDPALATTFAHLVAVATVLSRQIFELGIYPGVDPLDSTFHMPSPHILGGDHYNTIMVYKRHLTIHSTPNPTSAVHLLPSIHFQSSIFDSKFYTSYVLAI
ncbi:hypothetical protein QVD17_00158 [Tagetes erecta]|uniref:H(+)-transporting two-sector ATPase n=1 Tax=Tagetes erecta TaxID=13708 RepID=A0AAD8P5L3_TARER|nr:hypothetical protein QVD17_00158 [Tagetes erecta]